MTTTTATTAFLFLQLLGFSSADEFDIHESPNSSSVLSVLAVILVAGFVVFGEAHWLSVWICFPMTFSFSVTFCALPSSVLHICPSFLTASLSAVQAVQIPVGGGEQVSLP